MKQKHQKPTADVDRNDSLVEDYLAYRGYPLSAWNRALVEQKIRECPRSASRADLLRRLDRLLRAAATAAATKR